MFCDPKHNLHWGVFHVILETTCILFVFHGMVYTWPLVNLAWNVIPVNCFLFNFLSRWCIHCGKGSIYPYRNVVQFHFQCCYYLLYIFWCSDVRYIYIHNCYVLLIRWLSLYVNYLSFMTDFCLKDYFVIVEWLLFSFGFHCIKHLFPFLHFQSMYYIPLNLKGVSCQVCWCVLVIWALKRPRQKDCLCIQGGVSYRLHIVGSYLF